MPGSPKQFQVCCESLSDQGTFHHLSEWSRVLKKEGFTLRIARVTILGVVCSFTLSADELLAQVGRMPIDTSSYRRTEQLGGGDFPTADELVAMHEGNYILRVHAGEITKVPVEKSRLPFDAKFHPQGGLLLHAHDALIYAKQRTVLSKSMDGGITWTSWTIDETPEGLSEQWQVLRDGTFVRVLMTIGENMTGPSKVEQSTDEGRTWKPLTEIPMDVPGGYACRYSHWRMTKLPDETLFYCVDLRDQENIGRNRFLTGNTVLTAYRSTDGGTSWQGPIKICESVAEGGFAALPSGHLLASVRFQRGLLPSDSVAVRAVSNDKRGFKNHFLLDSVDGGQTWRNLRPLTTVYGQCYGYPAAQRDGTVVVVHDTRYGPGPDASRAMISHDEGRTWEDEVYYLFFEKGMSSYTQSVVLADDTILTLGGTASDPKAKRQWTGAIGNSHLTAIRWKPVKPPR